MPDDIDAEIAAEQRSRGVGFGVQQDDDVYESDRFAGMADSIDAGAEEEDDGEPPAQRQRSTFTAPKHLLDVPAQQDEEDPMLARANSDRIADREDEYHARRQGRVLSPFQVFRAHEWRWPDLAGLSTIECWDLVGVRCSCRAWPPRSVG